jgi:hypothetical protein
MSKIPTELTEKQFTEHIRPHLSQPRRGFVCQVPLYQVFNYILYWLHTGCQWHELPLAPQPGSEKKKSVTVRFFITFPNGVTMAVSKLYGIKAFSLCKPI